MAPIKAGLWNVSRALLHGAVASFVLGACESFLTAVICIDGPTLLASLFNLDHYIDAGWGLISSVSHLHSSPAGVSLPLLPLSSTKGYKRII